MTPMSSASASIMAAGALARGRGQHAASLIQMAGGAASVTLRHPFRGSPLGPLGPLERQFGPDDRVRNPAGRLVTGQHVDVHRHGDRMLHQTGQFHPGEVETGDLGQPSAAIPGTSNVTTSRRTSPE